MLFPVRRILRRQGWISEDQHVLRVVLLRSLRKVEGAGNNRFVINDHHLVVGDGVGGVDADGNPRMSQEVGFGVVLRLLTLIQDDVHLNPALLRSHQGLGDGGGGKRVGLDEDGVLRAVERLHDERCRPLMGGERDLPGRLGGPGSGLGWSGGLAADEAPDPQDHDASGDGSPHSRIVAWATASSRRAEAGFAQETRIS